MSKGIVSAAAKLSAALNENIRLEKELRHLADTIRLN